MTTSAGSSGQMSFLAGGVLLPASPPGAIGGAVITATRRSAGLSVRQLARKMRVSPGTVRSWENGIFPLFCNGYDQLRRLAEVLDQRQAYEGTVLAELLLAAQCDLLVTGILRGAEDYAEVPPIDEPGPEGERARDLLHWALTGVAPAKYRRATISRPLLAEQDVITVTAVAQDLSSGSHGDQLASYATALASLADS